MENLIGRAYPSLFQAGPGGFGFVVSSCKKTPKKDEAERKWSPEEAGKQNKAGGSLEER